MEDAGRGEDLELQQLTGTIGNNNECEVGILYSVLQHCGCAVPGRLGPSSGPSSGLHVMLQCDTAAREQEVYSGTIYR